MLIVIIYPAGCILAGGIAAGVYTTNLPEACKHIALDSKSNIIIAQDAEQVKKYLTIKEHLPEVKVTLIKHK